MLANIQIQYINTIFMRYLGKNLIIECNGFFQGTQSANPHNDYCQNFVDTGERPQNFIRDVGMCTWNVLTLLIYDFNNLTSLFCHIK